MHPIEKANLRSTVFFFFPFQLWSFFIFLGGSERGVGWVGGILICCPKKAEWQAAAE